MATAPYHKPVPLGRSAGTVPLASGSCLSWRPASAPNGCPGATAVSVRTANAPGPFGAFSVARTADDLEAGHRARPAPKRVERVSSGRQRCRDPRSRVQHGRTRHAVPAMVTERLRHYFIKCGREVPTNGVPVVPGASPLCKSAGLGYKRARPTRSGVGLGPLCTTCRIQLLQRRLQAAATSSTLRPAPSAP